MSRLVVPDLDLIADPDGLGATDLQPGHVYYGDEGQRYRVVEIDAGTGSVDVTAGHWVYYSDWDNWKATGDYTDSEGSTGTDTVAGVALTAWDVSEVDTYYALIQEEGPYYNLPKTAGDDDITASDVLELEAGDDDTVGNDSTNRTVGIAMADANDTADTVDAFIDLDRTVGT